MRTSMGGAALLIGALTTGGCYKNTIATGLPSGGGSHEEVVPFFLWGLAGEETFNLNQLCPEGVSYIEERREAPEVVLACLTLGLYSPVRVTVTCSSGKAWLLEPVPERGYTLVHPATELAEVQR